MMKAIASDQPPPALLRMNNYVNNSLQTECFAKYSQHNRDSTNYCVLFLTHNVLLLKYVMFVSLKHFFIISHVRMPQAYAKNVFSIISLITVICNNCIHSDL